MKDKDLYLLIISIILIICPFLINIYTILKLIILIVGIILLDIFLVKKTKLNLFFPIYFPIIIIIFSYSIDYIKTYTLDTSPIFVLENKINDKLSIYNSLMYRIYKCDNEYIFDNEYEKNFACNPSILDNIDINNFLSDITTNYQKYKGDFIKVTGKVSRITGTKELELKSYIDNNDINGHVDFLDGSNVIISLNGLNVSNYKIYDYITVVGYVKDYNEDTNTIILIDPKIEEKNLYKDYTLDVVEASNCDNTLKEYTDNLYTYCVNNIYLDYKIAKYELSYAIKDGKITIDDLLTKALNNQDNIYNYDKFNILKCNQDKYIIYKDNIEHNICN